jgi:hypothetical protein
MSAGAPIIRRFTRAAPGALNVFAFATDDETALTFVRISKNNTMLDVVSAPQPAAGINYTIQLWKNGVDTGRRFYSVTIDPASAGRIAVGPISLSAGDYYFNVSQTLGALAAYSFIIKLATAP